MSEPLNLETVTLETFTPLMGTEFTIHLNQHESLSLRLSEMKPLGHGVAGGRNPFALLFYHDHLPKNAHLPQGTFTLHHTIGGSFTIFLVPLGPDAQGMRYEAIFT